MREPTESQRGMSIKDNNGEKEKKIEGEPGKK